MSGPNGEACENCRFWYGIADGLGYEVGTTYRQCRRSAPRLDPVASDRQRKWHLGCWPVSPSRAWCGEFQKIDPK